MSRSPELRCLLDFLAREAGLPGCAGRPTPSLDSRRLAALLMEHQLLPLVAARRREDAAHALAQAVSQEDLLLAYYQSGRQAVLRLAVLRRALAILEGKIETVILKGMMVAPLLYREAGERTMRDVDLLVESADQQQHAQKLLTEAGFSVSVFRPAHHHSPPLHDPGGQISIEIHNNLLTPPLPAEFMAELWGRRVKHAQPFAFQALDPVGMFLHHALHALSNPVDSPLVRDLFETACLAARLSPEQQREARELAALSGRSDMIARAAKMAHELFGSPDFMPHPAPGPYERWCRWRLDWTEPDRRFKRLLRHFARERFDSLCEHPESGGYGVWVRKCASAVARRVRAGLSAMRGCSTGRIQRAPHLSARVGVATLVHDPRTGEVHLLNELGTALWEAAAQPIAWRELRGAMERNVSDGEFRRAVKEFMRRRLFVIVGRVRPSSAGSDRNYSL
jgi:hypothetical protein